jgi:hypothetical protein
VGNDNISEHCAKPKAKSSAQQPRTKTTRVSELKKAHKCLWEEEHTEAQLFTAHLTTKDCQLMTEKKYLTYEVLTLRGPHNFFGNITICLVIITLVWYCTKLCGELNFTSVHFKLFLESALT